MIIVDEHIKEASQILINGYEWSFDLAAKEKHSEVHDSIKHFITKDFKDWFSLSIIPEVVNFLEPHFEKSSFNDKDNQNENVLNDIQINIGTVHSAKGQTHCATMYVETAYNDYETNKFHIFSKKATKKKVEEKLPNPLFGEEHSFRIGKDIRAKEAMKMLYVGFSRPTHLLCFAVLQENVKDNIQKFKDSGWEIVDITIKG